MNCSEQITREHYVSNSILSQLTQPFPVFGLSWQDQKSRQLFTGNALAAKILCERHNSALSPLDTAAGRAFKNFQSAADHAASKNNSKPKFFLINGHALELWGYKTLAGLYFGKAATSNRVRLFDEHRLNINRIIEFLSGRKIFPPDGMYYEAAPDFLDLRELSFRTISTEENVVKALDFVFPVGKFKIALDVPKKDTTFFQDKPFYRPSNIIIKGSCNTSYVVCTWEFLPTGQQSPVVKLAE